MLTNLVASIVVTLSTNTTERFSKQNDPVPMPGAHEKWVTTTVRKSTRITVEVFGQQHTFRKFEPISETEVYYLLKWTPETTNKLSGARLQTALGYRNMTEQAKKKYLQPPRQR